ncbi:MAG: hypothetical protein EA424_13600 [Planctomycetaceae bacterium]|nr:MAG: hypothetical protein EA424_13600 [Planctomycetaceae bacterium]
MHIIRVLVVSGVALTICGCSPIDPSVAEFPLRNDAAPAGPAPAVASERGVMASRIEDDDVSSIPNSSGTVPIDAQHITPTLAKEGLRDAMGQYSQVVNAIFSVLEARDDKATAEQPSSPLAPDDDGFNGTAKSEEGTTP